VIRGCGQVSVIVRCDSTDVIRDVDHCHDERRRHRPAGRPHSREHRCGLIPRRIQDESQRRALISKTELITHRVWQTQNENELELAIGAYIVR
jgi:hypothetical protein